MKIGKFFLRTSVLGILLLLPCMAVAQNAKTGLASPRSVVIYADQAELAVQEKRVPEQIESVGTGILLALPQDVDEDTFVVSANGEAVTNYYFLPDKKKTVSANMSMNEEDDSSRLAESPDQELDLSRRDLLQKILVLETKEAELLGEEAAAQARITLWTTNFSSEKTSLSLAERQQLDAGIMTSLPAAYKQQEIANQQLVDVRERIRDAYNALEEYDKVFSCRYVVIPYAGSAQVTVDYHYCVPVSLEFSYVFNAFPKENKVTLEQVATVAQHSGMNWNNVTVNITTSPRYRVLNPAQILPWRLFFQPPVEAKGRSADVSYQGLMAAESELAVPDRIKKTPPVQQELGTARIWRLGKQSLANLTPTKFSLSHDSVPATYVYTLRPALGAEAFLTALVDQEKSFEFPAGKAFFLVDGIVVGEEVIKLNDRKFSLYFGNDPQVTGTMQLLEQVSDQQGLISKSNVRTWHWQVDVVNNRNRDITVYVEDSMPYADDKAIVVDVKATPEPEKIVDKNSGRIGVVSTYYRWTLKLATGARQQIDYKVTATAPADKPMNSDR